MRYQTLLVEIKDKVAKVILNRPDKKNAMNPQLHMDMTSALEALRYNENAAVLVITGAGESFCAGMDLKEFFHELKSKPDEYDRILRMAVEWRGRTLRQFPKPTIAMVNGYCFGGAFPSSRDAIWPWLRTRHNSVFLRSISDCFPAAVSPSRSPI